MVGQLHQQQRNQVFPQQKKNYVIVNTKTTAHAKNGPFTGKGEGSDTRTVFGNIGWGRGEQSAHLDSPKSR